MTARFVLFLCGFCFSGAMCAGCLIREFWVYATINALTAGLWYCLMDNEFRKSVSRAQKGLD